MSFINDFLNKMKLVNDDDEFDEYDEYDEYDDVDGEDEDIYTAPKTEKKSGGFFSRVKKVEKSKEETNEENVTESPYSAPHSSVTTSYSTQKAAATTAPASKPARKHTSVPNNVVDMRSGSATGSSEVCLIVPKDFDDANEISNILLSRKSVVLNLEGLNIDAAQRIIDFISGSCYAVNGNLKKISKKIFIATPSNVILSGDFIELENGETIDLNSLNLMK